MRDPSAPRRLLARAIGLLVVSSAALALLATSSTAQESPSPETGPTGSTGETGEPRDQIVLSGSVTVRRGEDAGEIVVFHGSVDVAGVARGDVIVLDGRILITGQVSGSVVNLDGPVTLGPNAHVLGDVIARERVRVADGAIVEGSVRAQTGFTFRAPFEVFGPFATWLAVATSTAVLLALFLALAPRGAEAVASTVWASPWPSIGIGLAVAVALPILAVLGVVSLVALPFGLALLLGLWLIGSVGFALAVFAVGRRLWRAPRSRWLAALFGWLLVSALAAIPFVGGVLWAIGAVVGVGASVVATRRARPADDGDGASPPSGRHRAGSKPVPARLVTERAMEQEGTGI